LKYFDEKLIIQSFIDNVKYTEEFKDHLFELVNEINDNISFEFKYGSPFIGGEDAALERIIKFTMDEKKFGQIRTNKNNLLG